MKKIVWTLAGLDDFADLFCELPCGHDAARRDRQAGRLERFGYPGIAGFEQAELPRRGVKSAVGEKTGAGSRGSAGRAGERLGDKILQSRKGRRGQLQLDNFCCGVKSFDIGSNADNVKHAAARPKGCFKGGKNSGVRIGKIIFVTPAEFDKSRLWKIDELRHGVG